MKQAYSRTIVFFVGIVIVCCAPTPRAPESCNQIELAPDSEALVSVLLPDIADDLRPQLTVRNARDSGPIDPWGACPTAEPYGACTPAAHGDVATVDARRIVDPGDGKRLLGFRMKNGANAPKRDVRLCVRYGKE